MASDRNYKKMIKEENLYEGRFWKAMGATFLGVLICGGSSILQELSAYATNSLYLVTSLGAVISIGGAMVAHSSSKQIAHLENDIELQRKEDINKKSRIEVAFVKSQESSKEILADKEMSNVRLSILKNQKIYLQNDKKASELSRH